MPKLEVFQAMWSMELRRPDKKEYTLEQRFRMVKEAGFDGIGLDFATDMPHEIEDCVNSGPLFKEYGLGCTITAFPKNVPDLLPYLKMAKEYDARFITLVGMEMPLTVSGMIPVIRDWMKMASDHEVELHFETHRCCITNDFYSTLQLLDAIPEMTMVADLSHYVVGREFPIPMLPQDQRLMRRLLERCEHFQGRIASRQQVQVPINFPQHQPYVKLFESWWRDGFRMWYARHRASIEPKTLNFMCELGPPDYAITGADGYELSDRWHESQMLKDLAHRIWEDTIQSEERV